MNWGPEETIQSFFPLEKGAPFDVTIRCEPSQFIVSAWIFTIYSLLYIFNIENIRCNHGIGVL